jgi:hypothetical protein
MNPSDGKGETGEVSVGRNTCVMIGDEPRQARELVHRVAIA